MATFDIYTVLFLLSSLAISVLGYYFLTKLQESSSSSMRGGEGEGVKASSASAGCDPILIFGLLDQMTMEFDALLRYDLMYSKTSLFRQKHEGDEAVMRETLKNVKGKDLLDLTKTMKSSIIASDAEIYDPNDGNLKKGVVEKLCKQSFRAIICADYSFMDSAEIAFIKQVYDKEIPVVVMALEGIFDLSPLCTAFGVDWKLVAYTRRSIQLTEYGQKIIGKQAFSEPTKYLKSHFIDGSDPQLFSHYINPDDYETSDEEVENDPVPDPEPGSPVALHFDGKKCASYFGFVNSLDVSYGEILLRLCHAVEHHNNG